MAKAWLKKKAPNRQISKHRVKHYASLMKNDRFFLNGETIKLTETDALIDGQHRLAAVVQAGICVRMHVARNVPQSAIISIDMGRQRSLADQLRVAYDYKSTGDLGTIIRLILEWNETGWISHKTFRQVDPDEAHAYIDSNPEVASLPRTAASFGTEIVAALMTRNQFAFLMWMFSRVDFDDAQKFMHNLVNSIAEYENDPCLHLRRYLLRMRSDRYGDAKRNVIIGLTIQNWNKWRARQPVKLIRVPPQAWDAESYPKPA
jgi:hypothetical protein